MGSSSSIADLDNLAGDNPAGPVSHLIDTLRADLAEAEIKHCGGHPDVIASRNELARVCRYARRFDEAIRLYALTLAFQQQALGPDDPATLRARSRIGNTLYAAGLYTKAMRWFRDTLIKRERVLGPDHPDTLRSKSSLANTCLAMGYPRQAERLHRETLEARTRVLGPDHVRTKSSRRQVETALGRILNSPR